MEYCIVAGNYPTKERQVHVFLENVVVRLVDKGEKCNVVAPQSYFAFLFKKGIKRPLVSERISPNGQKYMVYSPLYFVFPKIKIGKFSMHNWSRYMFYKALERTYIKYGFKADVVYSHFIQAGIAGVKLAQKYNLPSFIANGEADTIDSIKLNDFNKVKKTLDNVTGIISVSSKNKNEIKSITNNEPSIMAKTTVIVNAVDTKRFFKKDKVEIRKKMGWPENAFIIAFTGSFIERKGVTRLSKAIDMFDDVYSIFMGVGKDKPDCKNILHCGRVNNSEMNDYLNAADIFVLPTQAEGCSNAIVEAIMCGLPVISSDMEFNYDVLDDSCAILVDPNDINAIASAIGKLKDNFEYRQELERGAEERAKQLSLDVRVEKIINFIKEMMSIRKN